MKIVKSIGSIAALIYIFSFFIDNCTYAIEPT